MKRNILTIALLVSATSAMAQYQLPNSDFETDFVEACKRSKTLANATYSEPLYWHGYGSIDASYMNDAGRDNSKLVASDDVRKGATGKKSVCVKATSILGIVANGVMTTGRIYTHSTTATDAAKNYNYSDPSFVPSTETVKSGLSKYTLTFLGNTQYAQPFIGKPDAFTAWVKYVPKNTSDNASVNAVIHTNARYQDPEATDYTAIKVAAAKDDAIAYNKGEWQQLDIPFDYSVGTGTAPAYILVTFTTNKTPGGGSDGDLLYIDDIAMVYYSTLSTLTYDGTSLLPTTGNTNGATINIDKSDTLYQEGKIATALKGVGASVLSEGYDAATGLYTIKVAGNDNVNNSNVTTYNIQFMKQVTIQTGKSIETTAGKAQVTMIRDFKQGWNTVCLPFLTEVSTLGASKAQEFTAGDNQSVTFTEVSDGKLKANTPYLVFFTTAKSFTSSNPFTAFVDLQDSKSATVTHGAFTFSGNYKAGMNMNGLYGVANVNGKQRLCKGGASATLPEGCAYFTTTNAKANSFAINFDGQTTGIADATIANDETRAAVYNLQGIKVSTNGTTSLPAGIYIQGGRKVIVK